jgi:addiction module HigA family antidote
MDRLPNIHPGEVLEQEFLKPLNVTAYRLAKATRIPITRISEIIKGRRRVTADTALRLSTFFGNSPRFWLGLQNDYDLEEEGSKLQDDLKGIAPLKAINIKTKEGEEIRRILAGPVNYARGAYTNRRIPDMVVNCATDSCTNSLEEHRGV